MNSRQLKIFRVGDDVVVDAVKNLVYRDGQEFAVSPKGIQILLFLIARNGELVTYQEFESELWHGYNSQTSLYQQVASLRRSLGDSSTRPKYIKTISKQGYAFVGTCEELASDTSLDSLKSGAKQGASISSKLSSKIGRSTRAGMILAACFVAIVAAVYFSKTKTPEFVNEELSVSSLVGAAKVPKAVIGLQISDSMDDDILSRTNALYYTTKFHLENQKQYHISTIPATTVKNDWEQLELHFAPAGGLLAIYQVVISPQENAFNLSLNRLTEEGVDEQVYARTLTSLDEVDFIGFEKQLLENIQRSLQIKSQPQFKSNEEAQQFADLLEFAQNQFISTQSFEQYVENFKPLLSNDESPNLIVYSASWDIIFLVLDQQNIYNISPVVSLLGEMAKDVKPYYPEYFKAYHAQAEYYCRTLKYNACEQQLKKAYATKPYDYGILGNLRFFLKEQGQSSLQLDKINYIANPFSPSVYNFYRNSLLQNLEFSHAEELAESYTKWNSNQNNWYVRAQTPLQEQSLSQFLLWFNQLKRDKPLSKISKYNGYMLLNSGLAEDAHELVEHGLENLPYFDLLVIDLLADIWMQQPNLQRWLAARQMAEDRREFQNSLDKITIAYFNMVFDDMRNARPYIEEVFPELASDNLHITKDNFRYAVYFNECIKDIGDHRRSLSLDYALLKFLQQNPDLERNASFGLADVEFYALTDRKQLAQEALKKAVFNDNWLPNAFWLWPPLEANQFLQAISDSPEFKRSVSHIDAIFQHNLK